MIVAFEAGISRETKHQGEVPGTHDGRFKIQNSRPGAQANQLPTPTKNTGASGDVEENKQAGEFGVRQ
jgi:hypothetical protein